MHDIQVGTDTVEIQSGDIVQVEVGLDNVEVKTENSGTVDVEPHEYYLTSAGIYTGRLAGSIPTWLQNAIKRELTEGDGNLSDIVADLSSLITALEIGVNQNATSIETTNQSLSALETSVVSRLDSNEAAILNVESTKVTETEAQTVALNLQRSTFGTDVESYITNVAATYTDENSAVAQDINLLVASVNGVNASVSEISVVSVDEGQARAKHSLVVNADGNIAGYVAEAGTTSNFEILADTFKVSNGTTKLPIMTVDTVAGKVDLNGNVRINGGLVVAGTISATELAVNSVTVNKIPLAELTSADTIYNLVSPYSSGSNQYSTVFYAHAYSRIAIFGALQAYGSPSTGTSISYSVALQYSFDGSSWNEFPGNIGSLASADVLVPSVLSTDYYVGAAAMYFRIRFQANYAGATALGLKFIWVRNRR